MLKLSPDKTDFIIFGSYAQLKKFDPYLPVRIFGNFMHSVVVVKNHGVWFDANFSFVVQVHNICKTRNITNCNKYTWAILFPNDSIGPQLNFDVSLKLPL